MSISNREKWPLKVENLHFLFMPPLPVQHFKPSRFSSYALIFHGNTLNDTVFFFFFTIKIPILMTGRKNAFETRNNCNQDFLFL